MDRARVYSILSASGLPTAYRRWAPAKPPDLPYLVYFAVDSDDLIADNSNYHEVTRWCAELYSAEKDDGAEEAVKRTLKDNGLPYSKNEVGNIASGPFEVAFYFTTN